MKQSYIKQHLFLWIYTASAFFLLMMSGFLISQLVSEIGIQEFSLYLDALPLIFFRVGAYGLLLYFWPRLIKWLVCQRSASAQPIIFRRPLIILISCYELLIVQNPLGLLFRLLG